MKVRGVMIGGMILVATAAMAADKLELKTEKDKVSYAIGMDMAGSLKKSDIAVDPDILGKAIKDVMTDQKAVMTDEEVKNTLQALQKSMQDKQQEKMKAQGEKNKKEGEAFLTENKKKEGVKTTASGLQYQVVKEGKGKMPKATDTVSVQYKGTLLDGTEFDSSYKRGQAATFPVNGVIKGWTEALQLMKEGDSWKLFIPGDLAYGEAGTPGGPIGPNATLIFEVELVSIGAPPAPAKAAPAAKTK